MSSCAPTACSSTTRVPISSTVSWPTWLTTARPTSWRRGADILWTGSSPSRKKKAWSAARCSTTATWCGRRGSSYWRTATMTTTFTIPYWSWWPSVKKKSGLRKDLSRATCWLCFDTEYIPVEKVGLNIYLSTFLVLSRIHSTNSSTIRKVAFDCNKHPQNSLDLFVFILFFKFLNYDFFLFIHWGHNVAPHQSTLHHSSCFQCWTFVPPFITKWS